MHFAITEVLPKRLLESESGGKMAHVHVQSEGRQRDGAARSFREIEVAFVCLGSVAEDADIGQKGEPPRIFPVKSLDRAAQAIAETVVVFTIGRVQPPQRVGSDTPCATPQSVGSSEHEVSRAGASLKVWVQQLTFLVGAMMAPSRQFDAAVERERMLPFLAKAVAGVEQDIACHERNVAKALRVREGVAFHAAEIVIRYEHERLHPPKRVETPQQIHRAKRLVGVKTPGFSGTAAVRGLERLF